MAFGSKGRARTNLGTSIHALSASVGAREPARTYPFRRRAADACSLPWPHVASATAHGRFTVPRTRPGRRRADEVRSPGASGGGHRDPVLRTQASTHAFHARAG